MGQKYTVCIDGRNVEVEVSELEDGLLLAVDGDGGRKVGFESKLAQSVQRVGVDGKPRSFAHRKTPAGHMLVLDGSVVHASVQDARATKYAAMVKPASGAAKASIKAPMPGLVASVLVKVGDEVRKDQTLLTLSAMKLENDIRSPLAGRVTAVSVIAGQAVDKNFVMAVVE